MAKSVTAVKDLLGREERALVKLLATIPIIVHKETKAALREIAKNKRAEIRTYKKIIKQSEKCPAIKKPAAAKAAPKGKVAPRKKTAPKKKAAKKK